MVAALRSQISFFVFATDGVREVLGFLELREAGRLHSVGCV